LCSGAGAVWSVLWEGLVTTAGVGAAVIRAIHLAR
jgi:hypothetical protein